MILLRLAFGKNDKDREFDIVEGELLSDAVARVCKDVPLNGFKIEELFQTVVNGHIVAHEFWTVTKCSPQDNIVISPLIRSGDSGQIFKQAIILTVAIVASVYFPPAAYGVWGALATAAITIGTTLLMNALIPPPVPELGDLSGGSGKLESSQMYAISGQSNNMKRLGICPKTYGIHRMFPNVAATPYTELSVDPATGETVQTLYAIYDFGLGVMQVSDLKIGDTPLSTDFFRDFNVNFVDPNAPETPADVFDQGLERSFRYYKGSREVTALSFAMTNGNSYTTLSDANIDSNAQELILDFVCQAGLFGYSSGGTIGPRSVRLEIFFALEGTTDWHPYNDLNFVDSYASIGGTDITDFDQRTAYTTTADDDYYVGMVVQAFQYSGDSQNYKLKRFIKPGTNKLLVLDDSRYEVGAKVFYGNRLLGVIQGIANYPSNSAYTILTLDRVITQKQDILAHEYRGRRNQFGSATYTWFSTPDNMINIRTSRHESAAAIITGSKQTPIYGNVRFKPKVAGQYQVRVNRVSTYGPYNTQVSDACTWRGLTTAYETPPIFTDKRHLFIELRIKATDQLNGHVQNLSGVVSSVLNVYDENTETWSRQITCNPAWVFVDLLTGQVNKRAITIDRVHLESILEWAAFCDEIPTPPEGVTYNEPRFSTNFVLDFEVTLAQILQQVGSAAQASLNIIDGKYGVLIDRLKTTPVQIFTPRNSRDFQSTRLYGPRPHGVRVKFIDPDKDWEVQEALVYDNGYDSENATDLDDLTAFACTSLEQAYRFGRFMIAQNRLRQETITISVDFENLVCTRGDYVQITQDVMRVGGTPARVKTVDGVEVTIDDAMDIDPDISYGYVVRRSDGQIVTSTCTPTAPDTFELDGTIPDVGDLIVIGEVGSIVYDCLVKAISPNDDMSAQITLVEKADAIYDYESVGTFPEYDPQIANTSRPDFAPPKAVVDLTIADFGYECAFTKSGYLYFVDLVWDVPPGSVYELFEIWVNDGTGYKAWDTVTSKLYRYEVNQARLDIQHGFKVVAVSATGKKLQLIQMPEVTCTPASKVTPPSNVEALSMMITNQVLQLSWPAIPDCDLFKYVLRYSPDANDVWESSVPLAEVAKDLTSISVQARTGVYLIKAIDFAGNQSASPALATTTIPSLFDLNIVEEMNDAPDFDGTLELAERLGEAVILEEQVPGDQDSVQYYPLGYYTYLDLLDLDDVYSVRLQSKIRADGLRKGELMSGWEHLEDIDHLNSATHEDWDVALQYRATDIFAAMSSWVSLDTVDHLNFGAGVGFTEWRDIPTVGDATGRIFQFRVKLVSLAANVTPRLFDATVKADMPDRTDSFENQISSASEAKVIVYDPVFKGPGTSPNVQISIDDAETGDYWRFDYKNLEGFAIRFYDENDNQVVRQFDVVAKGYGRRHTVSL